MNQLISYIEFLLHEHNCVIVPNFGGFVINANNAKRDGISSFNAPACELGFNRDLTHNDGLLVQSYMKTNNISFDEATKQVEDSVKLLRHKLREDKNIDLGELGSIKMNNDNQFIYLPKPFVRPEFFGLSQASLKPIIQLQPGREKNRPQANGKHLLRNIGIGAAAAVAIALIMFFVPVQDNPLQRQYAQIFSEGGFLSDKSIAKEKSVAVETPSIDETPTQNKVENTILTENEEPTAHPVQTDVKKYYIVMGVYEVRKVAEQITEQLKAEGFSETAWLERPGRIDVYAASFINQMEAELFLRDLHVNQAEHRDAWLLKY